jgi:hypothetical protein
MAGGGIGQSSQQKGRWQYAQRPTGLKISCDEKMPPQPRIGVILGSRQKL